MSELTMCNHCSLKQIRERAKRAGKTVVVKRASWGIHPNGRAVEVGGEKVAWFAERSKWKNLRSLIRVEAQRTVPLFVD